MNPLLGNIQKAWSYRQEFIAELASTGTNCFRAFEAEGTPGIIVDVLGDIGLIQLQEGRAAVSQADLEEVARWYTAHAGIPSVYLRVDPKQRREEKQRPLLLAGAEAPEEFAIKENGTSFLVKPFQGFSYGIFLDQRDNRKLMAEMAEGREVLNLFAYTCGFSVAAALKGSLTTSVDLSKKTIDWGKRNFELNNLSAAGHGFIAGDVWDLLKRWSKQGRRWQVVIADPPSFSRGATGKPFSIEKQLSELIEQIAEIVEPGGHLFFSCNHSAITKSDLSHELTRYGKPLPVPPLPLDFSRGEHALAASLFVIQ